MSRPKLLNRAARAARALDRWAAEPGECPAGWRVGPPDFVGVGAQRSGTQWWYGLISDHPRVRPVTATRRRLRPFERPDGGSSIPTLPDVPIGRELHFFDAFADRPFEDRHRSLYHRFFPRAAGELAGEWTPRYMLDFWTPRLLRRAAPDARLLVLLRDPVERLRSGVSVTAAAGSHGVPLAWRLLNDAVIRSLYGRQLTQLYRRFERGDVLVLQYERCCRDPGAELRRTYEFLGLDPDHLPSHLTRQAGPARPKPELSPQAKEDLVSALTDDVRMLVERHPEIDLELWPAFRDAV